MQMPEENVIADARAKERSSVASQSSTLQKLGVFAGRYRWVICGLLFLASRKITWTGKCSGAENAAAA